MYIAHIQILRITRRRREKNPSNTRTDPPRIPSIRDRIVVSWCIAVRMRRWTVGDNDDTEKVVEAQVCRGEEASRDDGGRRSGRKLPSVTVSVPDCSQPRRAAFTRRQRFHVLHGYR